jgi:hypothetical protein
MDYIFDQVYQPQESIDNATLCELCALTAVGSRSYADEFEVPVMETLYRTAKLYVEDCRIKLSPGHESHTLCRHVLPLDQANERSSLAGYVILSKLRREVADIAPASGLHLARSAHIQKDRSPSDLWVPYRKVYRSFVFMEW